MATIRINEADSSRIIEDEHERDNVREKLQISGIMDLLTNLLAYALSRNKPLNIEEFFSQLHHVQQVVLKSDPISTDDRSQSNGAAMVCISTSED